MDILAHLKGLDDPLLFIGWALALDLLTRLLFPFARERIGVLAGFPALVIGALIRKLNRPYRSAADLTVRGSVVVAIVTVLAFGAGWAIDDVIHQHPNGSILAVLLIFSCLKVTRPWTLLSEVIPLLRQNPTTAPKNARKVFERRLVSEELYQPLNDHYHVARIALRTMVEDLGRGFLLPVTWYLLPEFFGHSGFIGIVVAVSFSQMREILAPTNRPAGPFGRLISLIDTVIYFIPARIIAILMVIAALFTPGASPGRAVAVLFTQANHHRGYNSGWPIAVTAGALNIAFDGGGKESGSSPRWIAPDSGSAQVRWQDLRRGILYHLATYLVTLLVLSAMIFNLLSLQPFL